jgi:hypothetical protein
LKKENTINKLSPFPIGKGLFLFWEQLIKKTT